MAPLPHTDFNRAYRPGEVFESQTGLRIPVRQVEVGELILTSGRIVACEPTRLQTFGDVLPFTRRVAPGRYPVVLCLVGVQYTTWSEERVAWAQVRFRPEPARSWEMALTPGQDPAKLDGKAFFGYDVEAGRGGFLDADIVTALAPEREQHLRRIREGSMRSITSVEDLLANSTPFFRRFWEAQRSRTDPERQWAGLGVEPTTGANVVEFSSGWGDGCYPSYWGLDDSGEPCCLVTDFGLLVESLEGRAEFLLTECRNQVVTHPDLEQIGLTVRVRIQKGPPLRVLVDHKGGQCQPTIDNGGEELHPRSYTGRGEHGTYEFHPEEPLQPDARLILTYCLGTRAL